MQESSMSNTKIPFQLPHHKKRQNKRSISESLRYEANILNVGYTSSIAVSLNQIMQKIRYTSSSAINIMQITLKKFLHILHGC